MKDSTILKTGIVGSIVAAICCATPALALLLGALGLSAWLGRLYYVLIPALVLFLGITAHGLWRRRRAAACGAPPNSGASNENKNRGCSTAAPPS